MKLLSKGSLLLSAVLFTTSPCAGQNTSEPGAPYLVAFGFNADLTNDAMWRSEIKEKPVANELQQKFLENELAARNADVTEKQDADAYRKRAATYLKLQRFNDALADIDYALTLDNAPKFQALEIESKIDPGPAKNAVKTETGWRWVSYVPKPQQPDRYVLLAQRAAIHEAMSSFPAALDDLERANKERPLRAQELVLRARLKSQLGDKSGQIADLRRAFEIKTLLGGDQQEEAQLLTKLAPSQSLAVSPKKENMSEVFQVIRNLEREAKPFQPNTLGKIFGRPFEEIAVERHPEVHTNTFRLREKFDQAIVSAELNAPEIVFNSDRLTLSLNPIKCCIQPADVMKNLGPEVLHQHRQKGHKLLTGPRTFVRYQRSWGELMFSFTDEGLHCLRTATLAPETATTTRERGQCECGATARHTP